MKYVWLPWLHPIDRLVRSKCVHGAPELHSNKSAAQQRQRTSKRYSLSIDSSMSIYSFHCNRLRILAILFVSIFSSFSRHRIDGMHHNAVMMRSQCQTPATWNRVHTYVLCTTFPPNAHSTPSISVLAHAISNVKIVHIFFLDPFRNRFFRSISVRFCSLLPFSRLGKLERCWDRFFVVLQSSNFESGTEPEIHRYIR